MSDANEGLAKSGIRRMELENVTETLTVPFERSSSMPAGDVARAAAAELLLPDNTPYVLRNERTSEVLRPDVPIGDQIAEGERVKVVPQSSLG